MAAIAVARHHDLRPGETLVGTVLRLPEHGGFRGNSVILRLDSGETIAIPATSKRGALTIERALERLGISSGDRIKITFVGWRESRSTGHAYRDIRVERIEGTR
jgi:hypothetical protein